MGLTPIWEPWSIAARNEPVPGNIRRILKRKGLKQCAVAHKVGKTAQEITDMLRGRRIIYARDIHALAAALEVNVSELFQDPEESGQEAEKPEN